MKKLRIARVAPLYESVPPKLCGGTVRIVCYLISPEKRLDRAIEIARRAGLPLARGGQGGSGGPGLFAFRHGSVPEVMVEGETGFICDTVDEAVEAVGRLPEVSRAGCRRVFDRRFTAARMARDYLNLYQREIEGEADGGDHPGPRAVLHPGDQLAHR